MRNRHHTGRGRDRRAAGRSRGAELRIPWIARCAEKFVRRVGAGGELRRVGLAEDDRACLAQARNHGGVLVRHKILKQRRAEGRTDALGERHVLDDDRQAGERPRIVRNTLSRLRGVPRLLLGQRHDCVELRIDPRDGREARIEQLDRLDLALADQLPQFARRAAGKIAMQCRHLPDQ
jgi:hypothetical protein